MFYLGWTPVLFNHSFRAAPKTLITPQMHLPQDWFWPNVLFLSDLRECGKFIEKISQALDNIYFLVTFKLNLDNISFFLPHDMLCNKCINDCDCGRFQPNFPPGNNCNNLPGSFSSVQVLHCLPSSVDIFIHTNIFVIMANGGFPSFRPFRAFSSTLSFVRRVNLANQEQSHNRLENYFQLATLEYNEIVFLLCFYCPMKYFRIHCNVNFSCSMFMK